MITQAQLLFGPNHVALKAHLVRALLVLKPAVTSLWGQEKPVGIDDVREMRRKAALTAADNTHAFIVHRADDMTPEACQAFLKILEEPNAGAHFFLLARSSQLPETVLSRVAKYFFAGVDATELTYFDTEIGRLKKDIISPRVNRQLKKLVRLSSLLSTTRILPHNLIDVYDSSR